MRVILVPICLGLLGICEAATAQISTPPEVIQEIVRIANTEIKKTACESSTVDQKVVATLIPYTAEVAAGKATARFAVLWNGDIGCRGGSGTNTVNISTIDKRGTSPARIVGTDTIDNAASIERIISATRDSLIVDVYTWGPNDAHCCASQYERWTLKRMKPTKPWQPDRDVWDVVDTEPAEPLPDVPNDDKLPTAFMRR